MKLTNLTRLLLKFIYSLTPFHASLHLIQNNRLPIASRVLGTMLSKWIACKSAIIPLYCRNKEKIQGTLTNEIRCSQIVCFTFIHLYSLILLVVSLYLFLQQCWSTEICQRRIKLCKASILTLCSLNLHRSAYNDKVHELLGIVNKLLALTPVCFLDSVFKVITNSKSLQLDHSEILTKAKAHLWKLLDHSSALVQKVRKVAGYDPQTTNAEALHEYIDWVVKGLDDLELGIMLEEGCIALAEMHEAEELSYQSAHQFDIEYQA